MQALTPRRRSAEETPPRKELRGVVERLTYQNPENGYTVARLAPERPRDEARAAQADDRLVTIVGTLADLTPGEAIVAQGWWRNDAKHGCFLSSTNASERASSSWFVPDGCTTAPAWCRRHGAGGWGGRSRA